jgi:hypothetical protein
MASSEVVETSGVWAEINYIHNPVADGETPLTFVTADEERSTMQTLPGRSVWIRDVRGMDVSLDREGFVLVQHTSGVSNLDGIMDDPQMEQLYLGEMRTLLAEMTGASQVIMIPGAKNRYGERETEKLARLKEARAGHTTPARYPHGDVTDVSGPAQAEGIVSMVLGLNLGEYSRWALYNVWRSVTPPPQDFPLAVCDARTVVPSDEVTVVAITQVPRLPDDLHFDTTGYLYSSAHRWCYFRHMTPDEVLIFKTHDTDPTRAHRVPHSAFTDPQCPPGIPTRASIEVRGLALFR